MAHGSKPPDLVAAEAGARCADCGVETMRHIDDAAMHKMSRDEALRTLNNLNSEFYMVHDEVWEASGIHDEHDMTVFLCIGCLESRIGRKLTWQDFADVPLNRISPIHSARLNDRMANPFGKFAN